MRYVFASDKKSHHTLLYSNSPAKAASVQMEELVEDPLVLDAALALIDDWYGDGECSSTSAGSMEAPFSNHGLRKRARDDIASLRSAVQELKQRARKRRRPLPEPPSHLPRAESDGHTSEESVEKVVMPTRRMDVQARRLLHAIHWCNQLQTAMHVTLSMVERIATRPTDEQVLAAYSTRLDALTTIARATPAPSSIGKGGYSDDFSFTPNCFRARIFGSMSFPFKLSIVAGVMWDTAQSVRFGRETKGQVSVRRHNEAIATIVTNVNTPSGYMSSRGLAALRRIDEDDGSVLLMHTTIMTSPPESSRPKGDDSSSGGRPNVLAGCAVKQAGWTRLRYDRGQGKGRPLVLLERSHGVVVEASPGCSVTKERLELILNVFGEMGAADDHSPQALEN